MERADSSKTHMGLTSWENAPDGKIIKTDVVIAKNYLTGEELESLGRIVSAYLDLAEERAKRKIPMTMEDWAKRLDAFFWNLPNATSCKMRATFPPKWHGIMGSGVGTAQNAQVSHMKPFVKNFFSCSILWPRTALALTPRKTRRSLQTH